MPQVFVFLYKIAVAFVLCPCHTASYVAAFAVRNGGQWGLPSLLLAGTLHGQNSG